MANAKPKIIIPSQGPIENEFQQKTEDKFRNIDTLIYAVVVAIVITAMSALISVGAIIIDQLHFNNQTYREFSGLKEENVELMKRVNNIESKIEAQNQQIIIEQQKQIQELLKKK